jgi:hypothetical protein
MTINERGNTGAFAVLRAAALVAVAAGAAGSLGFMLIAGHPPLFLRVLFAIWVLSPFAALVAAHAVSTRWSRPTRSTLYSVMLAVALVSLSIYGAVALGPPRPQEAFVFVVVPPASWLLIAVALPLAARLSRTPKPPAAGTS